MPLSPTQARTRLERMLAGEPVLSTVEIDDLLEDAKRADSGGRIPTDPAWVPTWDLEYSAAKGWEWKANKVSGDFRASFDGQSFDLQQVYDHCMKQAAHYRAQVQLVPVRFSRTDYNA